MLNWEEPPLVPPGVDHFKYSTRPVWESSPPLGEPEGATKCSHYTIPACLNQRHLSDSLLSASIML